MHYALAERDAVAVLTASTPDDRQKAVAVLVKHGSAAEPVLARLLTETKDEDVKLRMIQALVEMRGYSGVPAIIGALEDEAPAVRRRADEALQSMLHIRVRYDADAPAAERAAAIERYRVYWKKLAESNLVGFLKEPERAQEAFRQQVMFVGRDQGKREDRDTGVPTAQAVSQ